jgi:uncharacterized protein YjiS (DUF1127 family)
MMTRPQSLATGSIKGQTLPAAARSSAASRQTLLVSSIKQLIAWIRSTHRVHRGIHELMALDDRMLADIGLNRGAIMYTAQHGRLPDTISTGGSHVASSR